MTSMSGGKMKDSSPHKRGFLPFFEAMMLPRIPTRILKTINLYMLFFSQEQSQGLSVQVSGCLLYCTHGKPSGQLKESF